MSAVELLGAMLVYRQRGYTEFHVCMDEGAEYVLLVNRSTMFTVRIYANGGVWEKTTGEYVMVKGPGT